MIKLKKMLIALVVGLLVMTSQAFEVQADSADSLVIHYFRYDGNYTPWSLWLWQYEPVDGGGQRFNFTGDDDFGKVLTVELDGTILEGATSVGFIVSTPSWEKDVNSNRYVDVTKFDENGDVHIYLVQNNPTVYFSADDVDRSNRVFWAYFSDENTVKFETTIPVTEDKVSFYVDNVLTPFTDYAMVERLGTFNVSANADLSKAYKLSVDFGDTEPSEIALGFNGLYDTEAFEMAFAYEGELGAIYNETETTFRLWAPISEAVTLNLYTKGHPASVLDDQGVAGVDDPSQTIPMVSGEKGTWQVIVDGDLNGIYYTYSVTNAGITNEVIDPYAKAAGVNGDRGMVLDFADTNPLNWENDVRPDTMDAYTDAIIYELHVRDLTTHESWNGTDAYRGKFKGLFESGTTYDGLTTGFDHIKELGVTHVQLLPVFDHGIVDETRLNDSTYEGIVDGIFNWGYMPENFNVVEGSYSTNPYDGAVRITEFKEMIQAYHAADLRIIMDVVYNHTGKSGDSNFELILPGYYFRMKNDGMYSNGSGTGNETASERYMMSKYIVDSTLFWVNEYHVDGFRFDLMKLHDVETMNAVADAVHAIDDTIMVYGEPWTGGTSQLPESEAAYNATLDEMPGVAVFNDDTRDAIKGSVFDSASIGFVQGNQFSDAKILLGITGGTEQEGLDPMMLPKGTWAVNPTQAINYVDAHDNNTLHDKLKLSAPLATDEEFDRMFKQSLAMIMWSEGIPFFHAGTEFMRSKPCFSDSNTCDSNSLYDHNSYRSPDSTNQIDWSLKKTNIDTYEYVQNLISMRKLKDVFTLSTSEAVADHLSLISDKKGGFVSYTLTNDDDLWQTIYILHNGGDSTHEVALPEGDWYVMATSDEFGEWDEVKYHHELVQTIIPLQELEGGLELELLENDSYLLVQFADDYNINAIGTWGIIGIVSGSTLTTAGAVLLIVFRKKIFKI